MARSMSNPGSIPAEVPSAHEGAHYPNPSSKPLTGPLGKADRDGTQRLVWMLFFILLLCVVAIGIVLGLVFEQP